jgi:hypothetical protein
MKVLKEAASLSIPVAFFLSRQRRFIARRWSPGERKEPSTATGLRSARFGLSAFEGRKAMGQFPTTESNITTLAEEMAAGFADHADVYPAPPVTPENLTTFKGSFVDAKNALVAAQAALEQAKTAKDRMLGELVADMKKLIRYAENTVNGSDDLLRLIGWSGRKTPSPTPAPGQTRLLVVTRQEEAAVDLTWKAPIDGGKPNAYRVVRRERPAGPWMDVATAVETEVSLIDQPRGKEFEFRIIAVNKSGEGEPSNTVVVVL